MKTLLNPFYVYSEKQLLAVGLLFAAFGIYIGSFFNARFDGVIDVHFVEKSTFTEVGIDIAISILTVTLLLFILGKYINSKTRFVDMLATGLIAKIPFYFLVFSNINNTVYNISLKLMDHVKANPLDLKLAVSDIVILVLSAIISLVFLVWTIVLLLNGFKTATNAKGTRNILLFAVALLLAEILSKLLISLEA